MRPIFLFCLALLVGCNDTQSGSNSIPAIAAGQGESTAAAHRDEWLHGTWELTYDPDKSPTDWLIFAADSSVEVETEDGRVISGRYVLDGSSLTLTMSLSFRDISIPLQVSSDRSQISNESGAYYTKLVERPAG